MVIGTAYGLYNFLLVIVSVRPFISGIISSTLESFHACSIFPISHRSEDFFILCHPTGGIDLTLNRQTIKEAATVFAQDFLLTQLLNIDLDGKFNPLPTYDVHLRHNVAKEVWSRLTD